MSYITLTPNIPLQNITNSHPIHWSAHYYDFITQIYINKHINGKCFAHCNIHNYTKLQHGTCDILVQKVCIIITVLYAADCIRINPDVFIISTVPDQ